MASKSETSKSSVASMPLEWDLSNDGDSPVGEPVGPVIELTESAQDEVRRLLVEEGQSGLRLGIKGGGCSGLS